MHDLAKDVSDTVLVQLMKTTLDSKYKTIFYGLFNKYKVRFCKIKYENDIECFQFISTTIIR